MNNPYSMIIVALVALLCGNIHAAEGVFVECESFQERGGWVLDQQFMDEMGSPYLLAHGMGVPGPSASVHGEVQLKVRT